MFKVYNRNTRKTPFSVSIVNFEQENVSRDMTFMPICILFHKTGFCWIWTKSERSYKINIFFSPKIVNPDCDIKL